jgi:hypothetical protein
MYFIVHEQSSPAATLQLLLSNRCVDAAKKWVQRCYCATVRTLASTLAKRSRLRFWLKLQGSSAE